MTKIAIVECNSIDWNNIDWNNIDWNNIEIWNVFVENVPQKIDWISSRNIFEWNIDIKTVDWMSV